MVKFYLDENVHGAIRSGLRNRGADVLSVQEDGLEGLPDPQVLDRATSLGRVLFSQDRDLLIEASRRQRAGESFGGVVYAHQRQVTLGECLESLQIIADLGEPDEFLNRVQFLPL